jgi:hypothetical protein
MFPAITAGVMTALVLGLSGCGQSSPTSPSRVTETGAPGSASLTAVSSVAARFAREANVLHVSWSCFTGAASGGNCPAARVSPHGVAAGADITSAPTNLSSLVQGTTVTLGWGVPPGSQPTSYVIEAGSSAGASNITTFDTRSTATGLTVGNVPPGTYFVRVRGKDGASVGPASNEVTVVVTGVSVAPDPCQPRDLSATVVGSDVALGWVEPPGAGDQCGSDRYLIQAGSSPGVTDLVQVSTIGLIPSYFASELAPGTYYVRVRSQGASLSEASNEIVVTVTGVVPPGLTTWTGLVANGDGATIADDDCGVLRSDVTVTLVQSGTNLSGHLQSAVRVAPACAELVGFTFGEPINGTVTGALATGTGTFSAATPTGTITGSYANGRMTGTLAIDGEAGGTFTLNRQ